MADSDNVRVGVTGDIYLGTVGATLPTDETGDPDGAFTALGFADESGVVETQGETVTNIKAWQNSAVVRKIQTEHDLTYQFTCLETNETVLEAYYGNFSGTLSDWTVEIKGEVSPILPWVIDVFDGDAITRVVIPKGQVTSKGAVTYGATDAVKYAITVTAFPDESDVKAYIYGSDGSGS